MGRKGHAADRAVGRGTRLPAMDEVRSAIGGHVAAASVADLLHHLQRTGRLVFFTGAGISASAGVPLGVELADAIRFMTFLDYVGGKRVKNLDAKGFSPNAHVQRRVGQLLARFGDQVSAAALDWLPRKAEEREVLLAFDRFCQTATVTLPTIRKSVDQPPLLHQLGYAELFDWRFRNRRNGRDAFIRDVVVPYPNPGIEHLLLADLAHTQWQRPTFEYPHSPRNDTVHPVLFTFNFDHLIERALSLIGAGVYSGDPAGQSSNRQPIPGLDELLAPAVIHLHGHSGSGILITKPEMLRQSKRIHSALSAHLSDLSIRCGGCLCLVVLGYSGNPNDALFNCLRQFEGSPDRPRLFWSSRDAELPRHVTDLLEAYGDRASVLEPTLSAVDVLEGIWESLRGWPITSLYRQQQRWLSANHASPRGGVSSPASVTPSVGAVFRQHSVPYWALSPLCRAEVRLDHFKEEYDEIRLSTASDRSRIEAWQRGAESELETLEAELNSTAGRCRFRHHLSSVRHFMRWQFHPGPEATALKHALREGWLASDHRAFLDLVAKAQRLLDGLPLRHARRIEAERAAGELEQELRRKEGPAPSGRTCKPALRSMIGLT